MKPFTVWKWKHISRKNLKEAHSETHFENENMFLEKWKVIMWLNSQQPKTKRHIEHHSQVPKAIEQMYTNMTLLLKFSNWVNEP